jgi:hypothetical protein
MEKIIQLNFKWGIVQQTMAMIAGGYIVTLLTFTELVLRSHVIGNIVKCWDILFIARNYHGSPRVSGEDVSQDVLSTPRSPARPSMAVALHGKFLSGYMLQVQHF